MTNPAIKIPDLPPVRGRITENAPLGEVGWFRAGGTADVLFKPEDRDDLAAFLGGLPADVPLHMFGVLSNCIIRDGGVRGVVIRLGKEFAAVEPHDDATISAGAAALDGTVAMAAAKAGIAGLEFYSGIPGTIGGALRMNGGCYGTETKDVLVRAEALDRQGRVHHFTSCHFEDAQRLRNLPDDNQNGPGGVRSFACAQDDSLKMTLSYRHNDLPNDFIFISAIFRGEKGEPETIKEYMKEIKERRNDSQPIRERTGGSTFANPAAEEIAKAGLPEGTKVWQLIDMADCRGLKIGGAQMSEKHCNFMINIGGATGADLENLGEEVRRRVADKFGITLRWEIKRIGEHV
ncbi:MAG: UDP-N-acetylmuramate dehydrogenase [Rhodospirillales bacterium]|nr:UDP-N-acetylmuramate dehydrogenase [Rhodospirillales bacterium]MCB9996688.1 UDP-N-acetylmuramate dehydrogenase [Rhodospirillales bacterium]